MKSSFRSASPAAPCAIVGCATASSSSRSFASAARWRWRPKTPCRAPPGSEPACCPGEVGSVSRPTRSPRRRITTTAAYFQIRRRCGRAGPSTPRPPVIVARLPVDLLRPDDHVLRELDSEPGGGLEVDRELDGRTSSTDRSAGGVPLRMLSTYRAPARPIGPRSAPYEKSAPFWTHSFGGLHRRCAGRVESSAMRS